MVVSALTYGFKISVDGKLLDKSRLQSNYSYFEMHILLSQNHWELVSDTISSILGRIPRGIFVGTQWHF